MTKNTLFMKRKKFNGKFLYQCVVFRHMAKIGYKFNTLPDFKPEHKDFKIKIISKDYVSVISKNDAVKVWCQYIGDKQQ